MLLGMGMGAQAVLALSQVGSAAGYLLLGLAMQKQFGLANLSVRNVGFDAKISRPPAWTVRWSTASCS